MLTRGTHHCVLRWLLANKRTNEYPCHYLDENFSTALSALPRGDSATRTHQSQLSSTEKDVLRQLVGWQLEPCHVACAENSVSHVHPFRAIILCALPFLTACFSQDEPARTGRLRVHCSATQSLGGCRRGSRCVGRPGPAHGLLSVAIWHAADAIPGHDSRPGGHGERTRRCATARFGPFRAAYHEAGFCMATVSEPVVPASSNLRRRSARRFAAWRRLVRAH